MNLAMISLGCPKNQVDADVMCRALLERGHTTTADLSEADVIIINTCGFIESAKQEAIDNILEACSYKEQNPELKIVVTGCLAQRYQHEIVKEIPEVDAVVGLGSNAAICSILERLTGTGPVESYGVKESLPLGGARVISTPRHYAYIKIAEGCSNRCSYCAIPLIRGPLRSRTIPDIVAEARFLAGEGVKELIVVAQDVTAFGMDRGKAELAPLLDALNAVDGIEWIRLLYAYPERITGEVIDAMTRNEKVLHYLDVPIQHIDSDILRAMNRRGDRETVLSALGRLRAAMPDITLRTTLIAGYPGETEAQFEALCNFVRAYRFDRLGCFAYSEEESTPAALLPQLPTEVREQRAGTVMRIQADIMAEKQAGKVGKTVRVLCDGWDEESGLYLCRTASDAPEIDAVCCVRSEAPIEPGTFLDVQIEESDVYDLYGVPAETAM
ncbi:MAG: 30S ribosomal protein S12 methylthiotransferase RimO [Subdoligranulum sp.]|nr:30S ribosomal protein S12 methylthiotransferase RimO [Subdoligranulum sp.]